MSPDPSPLLTYTPAGDPQNIPTGTPRTGLGIDITPPATGAVHCSQILISVPVGPGAPSLFSAPPTTSVSTNTWAPTTTPRRSADPYSTPDTASDYTTTVIYDHLTGTPQPIGTDLSLSLEGAVNNTAGDVDIRIRETSGTTPDPATFTTKETTIMVRKTPADFYIRNFIATAPDSPTVPCTDFTNGAPIRLSWESNGTNFQLTLPDQASPIDLSTATDYTIQNGVTRDTTLILTATLTGTDGTPARLYDKLTLTINNPDLTPVSVQVANTLDVTGNTTLTTATAGDLTANGVISAATIQSDGAQIGQAGIILKGPAQAFGARETIHEDRFPASDSFTAPTDGFIVAQFSLNTSRVGPWIGGMAITLDYNVYYLNSQQGMPGEPDSKPASISIPIAMGVQWSYEVNYGPPHEGAIAQIYWFPLGL
ncbi:hypothetical protein [Streptomyces sp. NPDC001889]